MSVIEEMHFVGLRETSLRSLLLKAIGIFEKPQNGTRIKRVHRIVADLFPEQLAFDICENPLCSR